MHLKLCIQGRISEQANQAQGGHRSEGVMAGVLTVKPCTPACSLFLILSGIHEKSYLNFNHFLRGETPSLP